MHFVKWNKYLCRKYFWGEGNEMMQNTIQISYFKDLQSFDKTRISFVVKIKQES
jgi:hypothetical protein